MNLYDVLTNAALSVLAASGGDLREAQESFLEASFLEASFLAPEVFPPGSDLAAALNLVLGAVADMARGVTL